MTMMPTTGYEAEPTDVTTEVNNWLDSITDPTERYTRATAAQAHHQAVAAAFQRERDRALAELNQGAEGTPRVTYEKLAAMTGLTPSGVQKAVERGRTDRCALNVG